MSSSYKTILRSSSLIGGAQGVNYVVSLARMKVIAILLGPSGTGVIALYTSMIGLIQTIAGFGMTSSAVREIAEANAKDDPERVAHVRLANWRICWLTGTLGWIGSVALSWPLSNYAFGNSSHASTIALLGCVVLITILSQGGSALLQGMRQIGSLARMQVVAGLASTIVSIGIYAWLREDGVVPVLIVSAAINLFVALYFTSEVKTAAISQSWRETARHLRSFAGLGFGFMWAGLAAAAGELIIRSWIVRDLGLATNGLYQAAWSLSAMLVNFVLGAMGTDFFPRLSEASDQPKEMTRLVNEQTEIGILLSVPGLIGFLFFSRWIIELFYSSAYLDTMELLPWFIIGSFIRVFGWPLGFVILAKKANGWFVFTQTQFQVIQIGLTFLLLPIYGAVGAAMAFCLSCLGGIIINLFLSRRLANCRWSPAVTRLISGNSVLVIIAALLAWQLPPLWLALAGAVITFTVGILCLRGIVSRVGRDNALVRKLLKIPGTRLFLPNS